MSRAGIFGAAFVLLSCAASVAAELPRFDPPKACRQIASLGGGYSEMLYSGCMDLEQSSYDQLKAKWDRLPDRMQDHCVEVARFSGSTYQILFGCIQNEEKAADRNRTKSFRY